jgi:hypothetical protein
MTERAARLLVPLNGDQQALVDSVFEALTSHNVWPSVHYVERQLATPALSALLATFPTLGGVHYSAVWAMSTGGVHQADSEVGLTVAGLAHAPGGERLVEPFLRMLRGVALRLSAMPLHPTEVSALSMTFGDLASSIRIGPGDVQLADVEAVIRLIPHEPATWHGNVSGVREDWRWSDVPWHITRFGHVETVEQYLGELDAFCSPVVVSTPRPEVAPAAPDPSHPWTGLLHTGLRAHIADLLDAERWATAVRESAVYVEHELRSRGQFDSTLVGLDLVTAAMKPGRGQLAVPPSGPAAEQEGWHSLARGFMGAVRNRFAHGLPEVSERMAAGAIFTASLLLVALDEYFPTAD